MSATRPSDLELFADDGQAVPSSTVATTIEEVDEGLDLRSTASRAALVTAAGLALPIVFHALRLGQVFRPCTCRSSPARSSCVHAGRRRAGLRHRSSAGGGRACRRSSRRSRSGWPSSSA